MACSGGPARQGAAVERPRPAPLPLLFSHRHKIRRDPCLILTLVRRRRRGRWGRGPWSGAAFNDGDLNMTTQWEVLLVPTTLFRQDIPAMVHRLEYSPCEDPVGGSRRFRLHR